MQVPMSFGSHVLNFVVIYCILLFCCSNTEGEDEDNGNLSHTYEYDFSSDSWTKRKDMPIPRSHASSSTRAYGCGFLIISGTTNGAERTSDISYYDPQTDSWTKVGDVPVGLNTPVCDIAYMQDGDWLLCETGWTGTTYSYRRKISPT